MSVERHELVTSGLGMAQFPVEMVTSEPVDDHIMGVVVQAWLSRYPVQRWGTGWLAGGGMQLRFRRHLTAGLGVTVLVDQGVEMGLRVLDGEGVLMADGSARLHGRGDLGGLAGFGGLGRAGGLGGLGGWAGGGGVGGSAGPGTGWTAWRGGDVTELPVPATAEMLDGLAFIAPAFGFDADRDLAFAAEVDPDGWWRRTRWAHPAWVVSAVNGVLRETIAFADGRWVHAGTAITHLAPIPSGARVSIAGRVSSLFSTAAHDFAVVEALASTAGVPAMAMELTIVYR